MQLKTVYFDFTYDEWEKLFLYLKNQYGALLTPTKIYFPQNTSRYMGKRRHSAAVPDNFPLGADQWVIDLQAVA